MTCFELLKGILPVPQNVYNVGNEKKWNNFEKNTGIIFPKDYKELIGTYGTGGIGKFIVCIMGLKPSPSRRNL